MNPVAATRPAMPDDDESLYCPLCEYNLRGLSEPRCPECGYRFDWEKIRQLALERREFFFEHHRRDLARAFLRTIVRTLSPRRFFNYLQPALPYSKRMLWVYASIIVTVAAIPVVVLSARYALRVPSHTGFSLWMFLRRTFGDVAGDAAWIIVRPLTEILSTVTSAVVMSLIAALYWPVSVCVALQIFQVSMRRARIKCVHVLRCVIYSADLLVWTGLIVAVMLALTSLPIAAGPETNTIAAVVAVTAYLLTIPVFVYRLTQAYRYYLQFDHPVATVLAVQVIVALAGVILIMWCALA